MPVKTIIQAKYIFKSGNFLVSRVTFKNTQNGNTPNVKDDFLYILKTKKKKEKKDFRHLFSKPLEQLATFLTEYSTPCTGS